MQINLKPWARVAVLRALICFLCFATWGEPSWAAGKRVALVVGNGAYQSVAALPNPRHDAELVSRALRKQGFEVVTAIDLNRIELEQSVERFARALNGAEISLFYYSGHGVEVGGENHIVPIDATLDEPQDLETQTFSLQTIMLQMQAKSKAQLIYLDACRNNPFNDRKFLIGLEDDETPAGKGLAELKGNIGSLIAYAAAPGQVALDGKGDNSPFTEAVIKHSFSSKVDVQNALMKVTEEVWQATNNEQRPWINSTLVKPVFLSVLPEQPSAPDLRVMNKTLQELQLLSPSRQIQVAEVTIGAGKQAVFDAEHIAELPPAKAYKLLQLPLTGSLFLNDESLPEDSTIGLDALKNLTYEPSSDTQIFRDTTTASLLAPTVIVETAAIAADGSALPVQWRIPQRIHECDVLAAEPLDLQGVGKGLELDQLDVSQALASCERAVVQHNQTTRYVYLFGRAQLAAGNTEIAAGLIKQAADAGHVRAIHQLGDMTLQGLGFPKSLEQANIYFKLAADQGDPFGLLSYGRHLAKGIGMKADMKQGLALVKRAAELGHPEALDELGNLYLYGGNVKANPKRAVRYLEASEKRAKRSIKKKRVTALRPTAATEVGAMYFSGNGLPRDLRQAIRWYELGFGRGNQNGAIDLSWIFAEGPEDLRNSSKAAWFTSLALASSGLQGDKALLQRLALLPDDAKRAAMRDFINLVGPCAFRPEDGVDDMLLQLANKTWLQKQAENGDLDLPNSSEDFDAPKGNSMADELAYWNKVFATGDDNALLAYLKHYPDGVFADIARGRLGGLLEQAKVESKPQVCPVPTPAKVKKPTKKAEPVRLKQEPPKTRKPKPPPPVVVKPKPRPKPQPKPPVKRRPRPQVADEEVEEFEEEEPPIIIRRRPRFPRIPLPEFEDKCPNGDC